MNRALLIGINDYPGAPLRGCVNDVNDMADFLVHKCGFAEGDVRLLTEARATTAEIRLRLGWLLNGLRAGDRVLFHYSGHGAQMAARNPQGEIDGLDEVICPVDFDWTDEHAIRDDEFNQIFSGVPAGVEFIWISDSCNSGDLTKAFPASRKDSVSRAMIPPADHAWRIRTARALKIKALGMAKAAADLNVALISGCKESQLSADAVFNGRYNGALTYFLLKELSAPGGPDRPLTQLVPRILAALRSDGYPQEPQLEGSAPIAARPFLQASKQSAARRATRGRRK